MVIKSELGCSPISGLKVRWMDLAGSDRMAPSEYPSTPILAETVRLLPDYMEGEEGELSHQHGRLLGGGTIRVCSGLRGQPLRLAYPCLLCLQWYRWGYHHRCPARGLCP